MCIGYNWRDVHKNALIKLKKTDFWRAMKSINSHLERIDSNTCMQLCMRMHRWIQPCANKSAFYIIFCCNWSNSKRTIWISQFSQLHWLHLSGHHCKRILHATHAHSSVNKNGFHMFFTIESHFSLYIFQLAMIKWCVYLTRKIRKYFTRYQPVTDKKTRLLINIGIVQLILSFCIKFLLICALLWDHSYFPLEF